MLREAWNIYTLRIQLFQFTLSDQSFKGTGQDRKAVAAATSSTWNPNISFIQMARHRRSSLYGRGIVNFADNYLLRSHIPLRSCLVGLRLWSDNVYWNSCITIPVIINTYLSLSLIYWRHANHQSLVQGFDASQLVLRRTQTFSGTTCWQRLCLLLLELIGHSRPVLENE